ncbi:NACHT, LRR and PYD domains-containing protein 6-like, partial [Balaenoptera acutorostrata]|uniref:NACHT, LRR and PYD domains-containing protein 6-like n=1 Tax=Balaenoptera acutorostrata TaxID=9767 RepID=A0ABM3U1Y6_BALAC
PVAHLQDHHVRVPAFHRQRPELGARGRPTPPAGRAAQAVPPGLRRRPRGQGAGRTSPRRTWNDWSFAAPESRRSFSARRRRARRAGNRGHPPVHRPDLPGILSRAVLPAGGAGALLRGAPELRGRLALTTRFLFGPLNAERMRDVEHHFGCAVSERGKQDVPRWVQDQCQGCPRAAPEGTEGTQALRGAGESEEEEGEELNDLLELLHCLSETQEDTLVHQALRGLPELALERVHFSRTDLAVLSYCARCCPAGQAVQLVSCRLATAQEKKKKSLMKRLQGRLGGSS